MVASHITEWNFAKEQTFTKQNIYFLTKFTVHMALITAWESTTFLKWNFNTEKLIAILLVPPVILPDFSMEWESPLQRATGNIRTELLIRAALRTG